MFHPGFEVTGQLSTCQLRKVSRSCSFRKTKHKWAATRDVDFGSARCKYIFLSVSKEGRTSSAGRERASVLTPYPHCMVTDWCTFQVIWRLTITGITLTTTTCTWTRDVTRRTPTGTATAPTTRRPATAKPTT